MMNKTLNASILLMGAAFNSLGGCVTRGFNISQVENANISNHAILDMDATRRAAFITLDNSGHIVDFCTEPPPDVITTLTTKLGIEAMGKIQTSETVKGEGKLNAIRDTTRSVVELGKKNAETLFLREILYRRCEARFVGRIYATKDAEARVTEAAKKLKKATNDHNDFPNDHQKTVAFNSAKDEFDQAEATIVAIRKSFDNDDAFFEKVMGNYSGLVAAQTMDAHTVRLILIYQMVAGLPAGRQYDIDLLNAINSAISDPAKLGAVYQRASAIMKDEATRTESPTPPTDPGK